jgi:hypothetical protein
MISPETDTIDARDAEQKKPATLLRDSAPAHGNPGRRHVDDEEDERTFFQRHRLLLVLAILATIGVVLAAAKALSSKAAGPHRAPELSIVSIKLPPPPPPVATPPPPPPKEEPPKEEMIEQEKVTEEDEKPPDKPEPAPAITTGIKGDGPGMAGLGAAGGGLIGGSGRGGSRSRWGYYAADVQSKIKGALQTNRKTRTANINGVVAKVWADATGRITRAELKGSTGNESLDRAITNDVLPGIQLKEPPPADMPMPINLRINALRQN